LLNLQKLIHLVFLTLIKIILLTSCGGGGGSGEDGSSSAPIAGYSQLNFTVEPQWDVSASQADIYRTEEYDSQWGLEKIKAAEAYAALSKNGNIVAGKDVKISIVDSGALMSHQEISNNYDPNHHFDYINVDADPTDDNGHGTHVASTAAGVKDGIGMHGVAYDAKIVAFKVLNSEKKGNNMSVAAGINSSITAGAKIINLSLGSAVEISKDIIKIAKNEDILTIAATGNDNDTQPLYPAIFASDPEIQGGLIAVGSIDQNSKISLFSNKCGVTKDFCLVAPGESILGAYYTGDNDYAYYYGTSMATPHVSGAAAVLSGAWPHLTAAQTSQILLQTATDLGAFGTDEIYGRGLLNLEKAVQAQGQNVLSFGNNVTSSGYDLSSTSLVTDPIFGDAFTQNVIPQLQAAIFLDDFGRNYKAFLGEKISLNNQASRVNLEPIFFNNISSEIVPLNLGQNNNFRFKTTHYNNQEAKNEIGLKFAVTDNSIKPVISNQQGFSFNRQERLFKENFSWGLAFNIDEISNSQNFNSNFSNSLLSKNFSSTNPYQSFLSQNNSMDRNNPNSRNFQQLYINKEFYDKDFNLNLSYQSSYDSDQFTKKINNKQNQLLNLGVSYNFKDNSNLLLSLGSLEEFDNNILNSKSQGAFESKDIAKTSFIQLALNHNLSKNINLFLSYSEGLTKIQGNQQGIFRNFSDLRSRSSVIGLAFDEFFNGKIGFVYLQPLRIYSGKVDYDIAVARDNAGNLYRQTGRASLKPKGKEEDFEIFYLRSLKNDSDIKFNFLMQKESGNIADQLMNYLGAIIFNKRF